MVQWGMGHSEETHLLLKAEVRAVTSETPRVGSISGELCCLFASCVVVS
jgi:hypothetical protein